MTETSFERRKRLDHERYERQKEERKRKQRAYYAANREALLWNAKLRRFGLYEKPMVSEERRKCTKEKKLERDRIYQRMRRALLKSRQQEEIIGYKS